MTELGLVETKPEALTNLPPCFSERDGKSVWPGLVLLTEGCARTARHVLLWCTRLLFHHQCHLKSNQTRRQDPLEYNAFRVPAQDATYSPWGLSRTTPSRFKLVRPRSTHSRRSGVHDAAHSQSRRRVHQEPLGHNTLQVHNAQSHTTVAVCKPSTAARCTSLRRRLGQGHGFPPPPSVLPLPLSLRPRTKRAATGPHAVSDQNWPFTLQNRILEESKMSQC